MIESLARREQPRFPLVHVLESDRCRHKYFYNRILKQICIFGLGLKPTFDVSASQSTLIIAQLFSAFRHAK